MHAVHFRLRCLLEFIVIRRMASRLRWLVLFCLATVAGLVCADAAQQSAAPSPYDAVLKEAIKPDGPGAAAIVRGKGIA